MQGQRFLVLVVDDDEGARNSLKIILEDEYEVCEADGGRKALDVFRRTKPDLVFLDKIMPDIGGIEVLEKMKHIHPLTPVVIFTAYSNFADAARALEKGASDYIPKPFRVEEIRRRTAELLKGRGTALLDRENLRQRWMMRKRNINLKSLTSGLESTS